MGTEKPHRVVNSPPSPAVDAAETDEATASAVNAKAPRLLALEAKKLGALFVHFSTDYAFDGSKRSPYLETDDPNPLTSYGRTKLAADDATRDSAAAHLIFRPPWAHHTQRVTL